ncbi:MAG: 16S rRNA (adenine(1518)-N(6)/adenine(1519)-N(6))-dimethyltransferase RsmA [Candidatus Pacebacteria bacterium]|nr:16S rRNA (adenine(1518)-N(6)/adenine(1519)-N(6))-dimethyltransferase RsmA [Candidatus Paceibacterota bacterium]
MNLFSQKTIKEILKNHNISPSKGLGQNFLIDKQTAQRITKTASIKPHETILEIGPGIGNLTQELANRAKKVIAVEKDPKMIKVMEKTLKDIKNIEIVQKDILRFLSDNKIQNNYNVVSNIPYYLTAPVIKRLLESKSPPKNIVLLVQKEMAERICEKPPKMNVLAVSVQFYAEAEIILHVSKNHFWPKPKVDSAVIEIIPKTSEIKVNKELFFKIVKAGFSQPRKQLLNNLSKELKSDKNRIKLWLLKNEIRPSQRAETLGIDDWIKLTNSCELSTC